MDLVPTDEPDLAYILKGSVPAPPPSPSWVLIGGLIAIPIFLVVIASVLRVALKEEVLNIFMSKKVKVVADDTWVEPETDKSNNTPGVLKDVQFGVIKPRTWAFKQTMPQHQVAQAPMALRIHPDDAVPEATGAAWADTIAREASLYRVKPESIAECPHQWKDTTYTGWGNPEEEDYDDNASTLPADEKEEGTRRSGGSASKKTRSVRSAGTSVSASQAAGTSRRAESLRGAGRARSRAPSEGRSSATGTQGGGGKSVTYEDEHSDEDSDDPLPPPCLALPSCGEVEPNLAGELPSPIHPGRMARPPAAAKMLREYAGGMQRVAT
ncbi:unnamed protein product [Polarella glacialis]|uniref:Uncharacterized protein n=1 Tax=Polarella glacialis TaxID=89957 RepID=A0A813EY97_POLGL|nr:unnamed protein product [Polarella glacialis]